ncbi:ATP-grasp domain-containing protein [Pseudomonas gingeri NCPPB 3146 = LMG 5327]|uniref:ATP-grasp domain-containing protein n=2 Tax=Pseudomonas gingeri TaxID=117681 RepID=A0A7Y8CFT7_9PSED|nr:ATP-grasp domain-containing protein [Pseudomonas gingeri]NWC17143.1 ATP-grasp domain-containing protein [Pseudomonas gingeri]PNQ92027.1 ATP-grasp domain-containing protein [Pseudomonas gingeri NCPPB 3146 = LMG 5327]
MSAKPCVIVVGYNGNRVRDIGKLRELCRSLYQATLILLVEKVQLEDYEVADYVWTTSLAIENLDAALDAVSSCLAVDEWNLLGVLPFSDRGVLLGAGLATRHGLPGITPEQARAGLDKEIFRQLEAAAPTSPESYRPVFSCRVADLDELRQRVAALGGKAFIKPACEGASRGCRVIHSPAECEEAWAALEQYRAGGIIVEELVQDAREYSWDCVAGRSWVTEKTTTEGAYRAEIQQVVPAPLTGAALTAIAAAGEHMRQLVSVDNGAYHNEVFFRQDGTTSAVETNMRPAGMHIWDLARKAFAALDAFDPWESWVRWAVEGRMAQAEPVAQGYCGIRLVSAPAHGTLQHLPDIQALAASLGIEVIEGCYSKGVGDRVSSLVTDNTSFIGHVILFNPDYPTLSRQLLQLTRAIESAIVVSQSEPVRQLEEALP